MLLAHVGASLAIAAMLVPAAAGVAATAKSGPTVKFAKNTKIYSSHKATMWIKCLGKKGKSCKGKLIMKMQGQTVSKQNFSIKSNRKVVIHLHLTKDGKKQLKELLADHAWGGKCPVKAKNVHQGKGPKKTSTGEVGYKIKG